MIEAHEAFEASKTSFRITDILSHGVALGELKCFHQISLKLTVFWRVLASAHPAPTKPPSGFRLSPLGYQEMVMSAAYVQSMSTPK